MSNYWIFSNHYEGYNGTSDWDTSTILKKKNYYFKTSENSRHRIRKGDKILFRCYGTGFWGEAEVKNDWVEDPHGESKHKVATGWFPLGSIKEWKTTLPYEIIRTELSYQNHRSRIASATVQDFDKVQLALKIYMNLGYGDAEGNFFVLESGMEEAVKANLKQLNLKLAGKSIQQQCSLGMAAGRTDLICRDSDSNYVVLELKAVHSSDQVVGQILRYMGFIRENIAEKENKKVFGIILTPSYDEQLRLAAKEAGIRVLRVRII